MNPKNGGFPQQPWVLILKMIILGCFWGYHHLRKHPYQDIKTLIESPATLNLYLYRARVQNKKEADNDCYYSSPFVWVQPSCLGICVINNIYIYYIHVFFSRIFCSKIGSFHRIPQPRNRKNGSKWLQVSMILAWHAVGASGGWQSSRRPCNIAPYPSKEKHTKNKKFEAAFSFSWIFFWGGGRRSTIETRSWILDEGFLWHKKEQFSSSRLGALTFGCSHWPTSLSKYEKCNHFFLQRGPLAILQYHCMYHLEQSWTEWKKNQ